MWGEREKKEALRGEKCIYYNNLYRVMYKNPVREVRPSRIKVHLVIKGNSNC